MPKITEISEVLAAPDHCPFDAVVGVIAEVYGKGQDWTERTGEHGPYTTQTIVLRDRAIGSTKTIKVFLKSQPRVFKESKGQVYLLETGGKPDSLAREDNEWPKDKTPKSMQPQLVVKKACTTGFMRDGTAAPPASPARHQEAPGDHLAGDPTPQAQTHAQRPSTAQGDVSVTIPTAAQAIAQVKEGMKRPALAILLCLEKVDEIEAARHRRLTERLEKVDPASAEAGHINLLLREANEPNPELKIELLRSLLIQGGQCGLWDLLPCVSLDKKPSVAPVEPPAPAPVSAPVPAAQAAPVARVKASKPQHASPGEPGYDIDEPIDF